MNQLPANLNYVVANAYAPSSPEVFQARAPGVSDTQYPIQQRWFNTAINQEYLLVGFTSIGGLLQAQWKAISTGGNIIQVAVPHGISPIQPDVTGTVTFTSLDNTVTITGSSASPNNNFIDFSASGSAMNAIQNIITDTGAGAPLTGSTINLNSAAPFVTSTGPNAIRVTATDSTHGLIALQLAGSNMGSLTANNYGVAQFDANQFSVVSGFVRLIGGVTPPTLGITPDANTAPGTNPVVPNASGNIKIEGGALFNTGTQSNPIRTNSLAANTIDLQIQRAGSNIGASTPNNFGVAQFDQNQFTVALGFVNLKGSATNQAVQSITIPGPTDILANTTTGEITLTSTGSTIAITGSGSTINLESSTTPITIVETLSDDNGNKVTPSSNNIQLVGHIVEQGSTKFSTVKWAGSDTHLLNLNPMSPARWIVDPLGFNGTHTTIAAAITSATSGDTIFLLPGTYSENPTLKAGVNLAAYNCDSENNVIINGKCTFTGTGTVSISGIQLQTNNDFALAVTGTAPSIIYLNNCYLNCVNNTGISHTSSSAGSSINIYNCQGNLSITGIAIFSSSSAGTINIYYTTIFNSGNSTTANSISVSSCICWYCAITNPFLSTSTSDLDFRNTLINCSSTNSTCLVMNGTSATHQIKYCTLRSAAATAATIGAGAKTVMVLCDLTTTSGNALSGSGTINYAGLVFINNSGNVVTTKNLLTIT